MLQIVGDDPSFDL